MKKIVLLLFFILAYATFAQNQKKAPKSAPKSTPSTVKGTFKDTRNNKLYKTIKLGGRIWMAEDLNYKGKLYNIGSVKNACPAGWSLPSKSAWEDLMKESQSAGAAKGKWWAATSSGLNTTDYYVVINSGFGGINKLDDVKSANFAVRCVQNIQTKPSEKRNDIKLYKTVKIGNQTWMAENLNFKTGKSWCFENDDYNCNMHGRLYDWNTAIKACPAGWHLPTRREWGELAEFSATLGGKLSGEFSHAAPAEYKFMHKEQAGYWWGASEYGSNEAYSWQIKTGENNVKEEVSNKSAGYSVRCVKNTPVRASRPNNINQYKTVKIGNQTWMAENLNHRTGKSWCFENDDFYCSKYGRLYDWNTARKACPAGWRLPSDKDWEELDSIPALQGGWRSESSDKASRFRELGEIGIWWTATSFEATGSAQARYLQSPRGISSTLKDKSDGLSVRCIQNPQVKKISKIFTDSRDNKKYNVIKAGGAIWMKENLNYNAKGSFCYDNKQENCDKYGRLYEFDLAQTVCPAGWHLASSDDWSKLAENSGGETAGKKLKSKRLWNGTDNYGFSALPGGFTKAQGFAESGEKGYWWTSDTYGPFGKYSSMSHGKDDVVQSTNVKSVGFSVRCVMDCGLFNCIVE